MKNQDWIKCGVCKEMTPSSAPCCPRAALKNAGAVVALRPGDIVGHTYAPYAIVDRVDGDQITIEYWSYDHGVATVPRAHLYFQGRDADARAWWLNWTRRAPARYSYTEDMLPMFTESAKAARLKALEEAEEAIDRRNEQAE